MTVKRGGLMEDMISRHALCEYAQNQKDKSITPNDIMRFPSAQPDSKETSYTHKALDTISRQDAIDAVQKLRDAEVRQYGKVPCKGYWELTAAMNAVRCVPTAQPETHEERTETHACDSISRQWLIECVNEGWIKFDTEKDENRFIHLVRDIAPSAQPEIIRCKDCIFHGLCRTSPKWAVAPKDDWYCADAERSTDERSD